MVQIQSSYSIADIQDYFEFINKKRETLTENPPVQIYVNKIKNRIVFKIKTGYKLELLTPETMKLLGSTKKTFIKIKTESMYQNQSLLKLFWCIVIQSKTIVNTYEKFYSLLFQTNNSLIKQLINISPHSLTMMKTVNTEFSVVEVWFTDQASKAFEIEDNVNLTLIIGQIL